MAGTPDIPKKPSGMIVDGVFASEAIDSSGEIVSIEGMDISTMEDGYGVANYEHLGEDGGFGREVVGKIIYVRKILKESDCENDRQRSYWKRIKGIPFLYGVVRLYDGAGHEGAKALAAQIRDHKANDEPILVRYSIEGTTVEKKDNRIVSSLAKRVAMTLKPCNRTCVSDVLADPNAPEGFEVVKKAEGAYVDPEFRQLGASIQIECDPCLEATPEHASAAAHLLALAGTLRAMRKAIEAGNYDAAPSTLTGGAALQREAFVKGIRNQAAAAIRDYPDRFTRAGFTKFAKAKMPEVSEDFIQHFVDVAEAYHLKRDLAKAVSDAQLAEVQHAEKQGPLRRPRIGRPPKSPKPLVEDVPDHLEDAPDEVIPAGGGKNRKIHVGTVRGQALKPNPSLVRPHFDEANGVLHTPIGSFKAYHPSHDGPESARAYQEILKHPEIEGAMDHAVENWGKVHKLLKAGKLPPEVVMHAVMFSQLSPNKPVPTQEVQYARLVDAMDATGIDPRHPGFHEIEQPWLNMDHPERLPWTGREAFRNNPSYYQGGQVGVKRDEQGNVIGEPSEATGRRPGELLSISPLMYDFLGRASQYHKIHDSVVDLARRHRHNTMGAISEMMNQKRAATNWANVRRAAIKNGKPDPGEFKGLNGVPGLKVKTGLYTWGMLGGGNSVVPDTHFIRNMYGLDLEKDQHTIEYLKQLHWRPTNMGVMQAYNNWYLKNHPALQYTVNHPKHGKHFERPEDALFPAFWRHWLTIAPHEQLLGLPNRSEQAGTTHQPYWDAIAPYVDAAMNKAEGGHFDSSLPLRTALVHQEYAKHFGEVPAMMMFYRFLAPKLLEAAQHRERVGQDMKFLAKARQLEAALIDIRKNVRELLEGKPQHGLPDVHQVEAVMGNSIHPVGRFMVHNGEIRHLEDYYGLLARLLPRGPMDATAVARLHGLKFSPHLIVSEHKVPGSPEADAPAADAPVLQVHEHPLPPRPPVFEYHRPGMLKPHVVEFGSAGAALDGRQLAQEELQLMLDNVNAGIATLRYRAHLPGEGLAKAEAEEEILSPAEVMAHIRAAVEAGTLPRTVERAATAHYYEDPKCPGLGNQYAWDEFHAKGRPGVYLSMDGNDLKACNDTQGHSAGTALIKALGAGLRDAGAKVGGGKIFHPTGDEFVAHFPTLEAAHAFVRHARDHLDSVAPIGGRFRPSLSFGLGHDYETADRALYHAKAAKVDPLTGQRAFPPGSVPHFAHSLVPGNEGALPIHEERLPSAALPGKTPAPEAQPAA